MTTTGMALAVGSPLEHRRVQRRVRGLGLSRAWPPPWTARLFVPRTRLVEFAARRGDGDHRVEFQAGPNLLWAMRSAQTDWWPRERGVGCDAFLGWRHLRTRWAGATMAAAA